MGIIKFNNVLSTTPGLEVETFPNYVAPEKEYQVTHVPGRNGDLVVDTKTYKNVPRSYKVSMAVEPPAVSVSGSTASFEATAERALAECKTVISSDVGKVGTTIINSATDPVENNEPYNFRAVSNGIGDRENDTLIGGTVAWNQLERFNRASGTQSGVTVTNNNDGSVTLNNTATANSFWAPSNTNTSTPVINGHVYLGISDIKNPSTNSLCLGIYDSNGLKLLSGDYYAIVKPTNYSGIIQIGYRYSSGASFSNLRVWGGLFDLTQMFGSTIADYIYGLETATAGAGVAWFRNLFPKDYYPYNAGELISVKTEAHKTTGKNIADVDNSGNFTRYDGITRNGFKYDRLTGMFAIQRDSNSQTVYYAYQNSSGVWVEGGLTGSTLTGSFTSYGGVQIWSNSGTIFKDVISGFQLEVGNQATSYEPYEEHVYPLNPALELRGIPKLNSSNKLYYDGDIYSSDGSVIRKYGVVDLGSLTYGNYESTYNRFATTIMDIKSYSVRANPFICSRFQTIADGRAIADVPDNSVYNGTTTTVYFKTTAYTDKDAFKSAMSGVYLIYELATPVIESTTGLIDNVSIASFDDGADDQPVNLLESEIVAVESGNGQPKSPDNPYSISGFDNGIITRCGKNLGNFANQTISANIVQTIIIGTIFLKGGYSYTISCKQTPSVLTSQTRNTFFVKRPDGSNVYGNSNVTILPLTFTAETDGIYTLYLWGHTLSAETTYSEIQLELGNQATTYEAYNGNTYTFTFGQTVYGGHFDNKGNLVVTHKFLAFDYQSNWNYESLQGGNFYVACGSDVKGVQTAYNDVKCNCSTWSPVNSSRADTCFISSSKIFNFTWGATLGLASVNDFKTYLQTNNLTIQVVCELATPITLSITSQDIPTLLGNNNVFANTGNIKTLSYPKQVCPFEPAQEVNDHGTEEYIDNREVAIPVGHESKYFTAGKIYNFSWLDEAGLIKEGELDADTGVLTITDGYKVVDIGDLSWSYNASRVAFNVQITDIKTVSSGTIGNMSCSAYVISAAISSASDAANKPDMTIFQQKDNASVFIKNSSFTDAETFKSAMHGVKLLYELADPVRTIQLTPVQVESLIGHNVLISESGDISVTPRTYSTYTEKMNAISDWLHSASGYARLEDTYEPDYYRKAYYDEQTDMENIFNEAGQATLNFVCKPQRYLKSGEEPITISSGGLIQNRTRYEAYPILKVTTNNTQGSVAIGNHSITIKAGAGTDPITIDCELQDAWSGTSNKNSYIVLTDGEFPVIDPGAQTVTFDGGVQSVEVIPRWWTV